MRVVIILTLLAVAVTAQAATFTVNNFTDAVDAAIGDGACASAAGECTLRAAVQETNALAGPDTIFVPSGTFALTIAGADEDLAATGDLDVLDDLEIAGAGRDATFISASRLDRVLQAQNVSVTLSDMTLEHGFVSSEGGCSGGALYLVDVDAQLARLRVADSGFPIGIRNSAYCSGAGAHIFNGTITATDVEFVRNTGCGDGGGLLLRGGVGSVTDALAEDNDVRCHGDEAVGGGGAVVAGSNMVLSKWTVRRNMAQSGAGLDLVGCLLRDSLVVENVATVFREARGPCWAAGVRSKGAHLENVTISSNRALPTESSRDSGPAAYWAVDGYLGGSLRSVTMTNNEATEASCAALFMALDTTVAHCLILGNSPREVGFAGPSSMRLEAPILVSPIDVIPASAGDPALVLRSDNPRLAPLADNGGTTWTHALLPGSPALDTGFTGPCLDVAGLEIVGDQRGLPRAVDGDGDGDARCDLGAFEQQAPCGGPDTDGDLAPDACDCAPLDATAWQPAFEPSLRVVKVGASTPRLSWTNAFAMSGSQGLHDVASDTIGAMIVARGATASCLDSGLDALTIDDSRDLTGQSVYYLIRANTACAQSAGVSGWGRDSFGRERPTCP